MPKRILMDVDTGTDDAVALMLAALTPDIELVGVSTVSGNCPVHIATENSLRVLALVGARAPVYAGMCQPLMRPRLKESWESYLDLPPSGTMAERQHGVDWLVDTLLHSDGEITVVATAPLTNLAMAMRLDPRIIPKIAEFVIMGGGHAIRNMTPAAEFNFWCDPESADVVLNSGRPIRLVTLDATHQARLFRSDCERLLGLGTAAARATAAIIEARMAVQDRSWSEKGEETAFLHDALAMAALIDPAVLRTSLIRVDVETQGKYSAGAAVCDLYRRSGLEPNAYVALDCDRDCFARILLDTLGRSLLDRQRSGSPLSPRAGDE